MVARRSASLRRLARRAASCAARCSSATAAASASNSALYSSSRARHRSIIAGVDATRLAMPPDQAARMPPPAAFLPAASAASCVADTNRPPAAPPLPPPPMPERLLPAPPTPPTPLSPPPPERSSSICCRAARMSAFMRCRCRRARMRAVMDACSVPGAVSRRDTILRPMPTPYVTRCTFTSTSVNDTMPPHVDRPSLSAYRTKSLNRDASCMPMGGGRRVSSACRSATGMKPVPRGSYMRHAARNSRTWLSVSPRRCRSPVR